MKAAVPAWIVRPWRRIKYRRVADRVPRMAMFGVDREEVIDTVRAAGGEVVEALDDTSHGTDCAGFLYIARPAFHVLPST